MVIFFDEEAQNSTIKRALRDARRVRKELREAEENGAAAKSKSSETFSRSFAGRFRSTDKSS
jgi:hypothetical protein